MRADSAPGRPRIVLIGGHSGRSGVPSYLRQVAAALAGPGGAFRPEELLLLTDAGAGTGYAFAEAMGLAHARIAGLGRSRNPLRMLAAALALRRALRAAPADLVWANSTFPATLARLALIEARLRGRGGPARLIVTCHGAPFGPGRRPHVSAPMRLVEAALLRLAPRHRILFVSARDRAAHPARLLARHDVEVLANSSDLGARAAPDRPADAPLRVVMTTRDAPQKNLDAAADIVARLPAPAELVLMGQGTDAPALRARLAAALPAGAPARIRCLGPQDEAGVRAALAAADVYLMTSRYEGMPIGALEAFEAGLPIAMTDVGGADEIAAVHPLFCRIAVATPAERAAAARALAGLAAAFRADRAGQSRRIAAAFAAAFGQGPWRAAIRRIVAEVLASPPVAPRGR